MDTLAKRGLRLLADLLAFLLDDASIAPARFGETTSRFEIELAAALNPGCILDFMVATLSDSWRKCHTFWKEP